jgi:hypothetical protein
MYQLRQSRTSHGQLASRRVYFLLGIITRLPTHATLNTVYSPPFRTGVSSLNVFFLETSSFTCLGVINIINPWLVPDHSPCNHRRELLVASHNPYFCELIFGMCPHRCSRTTFSPHIPVVSWLRLIRPPSILQLSKSISIFYFFFHFFKNLKFIYFNFFIFFKT